MKLEEALITAIDFEKRVRSTYKAAASQVTDPVGKRALEVLAKEEEGHVAYLESRLAEWRSRGKVTIEALVTAVPDALRIQEGLGKLAGELKTTKDRSAELDVLKRAFVVEQETGAFYRKVVDELPPGDRELFERFLEIEDGHLALVQAEIDTVTGMGFWFDVQEFTLEGA